MKRICFTFWAILVSEASSAGSFLDHIRSYDLNDYALGVSFSVSESPYAGGSSSLLAYPYLTSFRNASFTDDWLLISEGDPGGTPGR